MKLPTIVISWLIDRTVFRMLELEDTSHSGWKMPEPDFVIGDDYLHRWWLVKNMRDHDTPRQGPLREHTRASRWWNAYLHMVTGDDDDRALHDHPWFNISIILGGTYREVFADRSVLRPAGTVVFRWGRTAHRLEVVDGPVWSLFLTSPKYREWGFRCPSGFRHWTKFVSADDPGRVGRGCE